MELTFNVNGNKRQLVASRYWNDKSTTEICYGGAKGSGKSFLGCSLILGSAIMYPDTFYFIARRTLSDLVKYTIPSVYEVLGIWGIKKATYTFNGQHNFFQFNNGSRIYLTECKWQPSDPLYERFGSMQMTAGWIEEGGEVAFEAKNNLAATIGRWNNDIYNLPPKLLITCNPTNNWLYTEFYKPYKAGELPPHRAFVPALPTDNKKLPPAYIKNLEKILTKTQRERLLYGHWEWEDDPLSLIEEEAIRDAFTNDFVENADESGARYLSADLAGKGRDRCVFALWRGNVVSFPIILATSGGKDIEVALQSYAAKENIPRSKIIVDTDGLGFFLESYMEGIVAFHGQNTATDRETYTNLRSECIYKFAEMVNKRQIKIDCPREYWEEVMEEMRAIKARDLDATDNKRAVIAKIDIKKVLGRSPDFFDAMMMGMYWRVKPQPKGGQFAAYQYGKM